MALTNLDDMQVPFESGLCDFGYAGHVRSLIKKLDRSGVEGTQKLTQVPAGWIGVLEVLGVYMRQDPGNRIVDLSEKIGCLRAHLQNKKTGLSDIDAKVWCEEMTENRCMVFGSPGRRRDRQGWVMTLSDAAQEMRIEMDPHEFLNLVYPLRSRGGQG